MPRSGWRAALVLARLELRLQRRDFLTWLAAAVFLLLTFGYASNGTIALVGDLGATPRGAPWALAQAMAGVTAFGQVITAMLAATATLRDVGTRSQGLVLTTPVGWRTYLVGRFAGTLAVLAAVYAAVPLGLFAGALVAHGRGDPAAGAIAGAAYAWPLVVLVAPNVVTIAACFFAAGALAGGFAVILFTGIGLVGLWQTGLALAGAGMPWGALLDPFGNAALLAATHDWTAADRATRAMSLTPLLAANRAVWFGVSLALGLAALRWWRPRWDGGASRVSGAVGPRPTAPGPGGLAPLRGASVRGGWAAEWRFGVRWALRERGVVALVLLALLNAAANGWRVATDPPALAGAIEFHSRIFGILIATIYAGELVWRDRDARADALLAALPASRDVRLAGRACGVLTGLLLLPAALFVAVVLLPVLRGAVPDPWCAARWIGGVTVPAFALLFAFSLAVHRVLDHKTVAHLVLIAGWVLAIAFGLRGLAEPWAVYGRCGA